ncbi:hypothetical protein BH23ACT10_BH23ACT10_01750 [soil metagenome]
MTLGLAQRQGDLLDDLTRFCDATVADGSIYGLLHRERDRLFPDQMFADLYTDRGRRSVPPSVLACVMVLQRLEGCSDREAADRFAFDARWRYACGVGGWEAGPTSFVHTVLVRTRMRLRGSDDPDRVFRVSTEVAADAGLVGVKRVLDSAPVHDAVATMDTVTLLRSAIRGLLRAADAELAAQLRAVLCRDDDYVVAGKPACAWDDPQAREALIDGLAADGLAVLAVVEDRELSRHVAQAAELLARVLGQDVERDDDGRFRIIRGVAADRVISVVDVDARHGHKTSARKFDGYKGHIAIDPDSEIITGAQVGAANAGDAAMTEVLLGDLAGQPDSEPADETDAGADGDVEPADDADAGADGDVEPADEADAQPDAQADADSEPADDESAVGGIDADSADHEDEGRNDDASGGGDRPAVYGDAAYGSGDNLETLDTLDADAMVKVPPATAPGGRLSKDDFDIDLDSGQATCPDGNTTAIRFRDDGSGTASFGQWCADCPLRQRCTTAKAGRTLAISRHERRLAAARVRQRDPAWQADYRATRPKVERKLAHLLRRRHGGRYARMRGLRRVDQDWKLLAGAHNLARLAALGVRHVGGTWQTAPAAG